MLLAQGAHSYRIILSVLHLLNYIDGVGVGVAAAAPASGGVAGATGGGGGGGGGAAAGLTGAVSLLFVHPVAKLKSVADKSKLAMIFWNFTLFILLFNWVL